MNVPWRLVAFYAVLIAAVACTFDLPTPPAKAAVPPCLTVGVQCADAADCCGTGLCATVSTGTTTRTCQTPLAGFEARQAVAVKPL